MKGILLIKPLEEKEATQNKQQLNYLKQKDLNKETKEGRKNDGWMEERKLGIRENRGR